MKAATRILGTVWLILAGLSVVGTLFLAGAGDFDDGQGLVAGFGAALVEATVGVALSLAGRA